MKIFVTKDDSTIENFTNIKLNNLSQEMPDVVDNSCEDIVLNDVVDFVQYSSVGNLLKLVVSKLRTNGRLVLTGADLGLVCRAVVNGEVSPEQYSSLMAGRLSTNFMHIVVESLSNLGLTVQTANSKGIIYEIVATR